MPVWAGIGKLLLAIILLRMNVTGAVRHVRNVAKFSVERPA